MTAGTHVPERTGSRDSCESAIRPEVTRRAVLVALVIALTFVGLTRWPLRRLGPDEFDEFYYLETIRDHAFPMHHTLFLAAARVLGQVVGDAYAGFVVLDMAMSAVALVSAWWWLRALVRPPVAVAAAAALAVGPKFWAYGAMVGNYPAIVLVGSFLLGVAVRTWRDPRPWHPYAAAVVFALGTGYREDIGVLWMPIFLAILWRHRWRSALASAALFATVNLSWFGLMLHDAGGWEPYRAASRSFAQNAGYSNSVFHLGLVDASLRNGTKAAMALLWTLGPGLLFVPRGMRRLLGRPDGRAFACLLAASVMPAFLVHMMIHFGVPGYAFHYVPALLLLTALGIGRVTVPADRPNWDRAVPRLATLAGMLAAVFLFYPTDYSGLRRDFDLAFARQTRVGLRTRTVVGQAPGLWRTSNSRPDPTRVPDLLRSVSPRGN
jgi:hypothetical protein